MFNRGADSVSAAHVLGGAPLTTPWGWGLAMASSPQQSQHQGSLSLEEVLHTVLTSTIRKLNC